MVRALAAGRVALRRRTALHQAEILRPRNAALSVRRAAHGTRAQLRHRRRARPLHVDERLQRASSHGLGFIRLAGRERRHPEQHAAARVDAAQHRRHEGADEAPGLRLRLVARSHHLPARILQMEPVVLHQALREGPGLSQEEQGQLVSEVRHGAGQRAGGQRMLLAPRRHAGRAARTRTVVSAHHQLCRGVAARPRPPSRLAGKSPHHAAQLDWPQRRHAGRFQARRRDRSGEFDHHRLHHSRRHDLRRDLAATRASASPGRPLDQEQRPAARRQSINSSPSNARPGKSATSARSKSTASTPAATPSIPTTAKRFRSGWPTTS